jgi:hypothetical protein
MHIWQIYPIITFSSIPEQLFRAKGPMKCIPWRWISVNQIKTGFMVLGFHGGYLLMLILFLGCYILCLWAMFRRFGGECCLHLQVRRWRLRTYPTITRCNNQRTESVTKIGLFNFVNILLTQCPWIPHFISSLAEIPGVARVDHRTKCVSMVAISLSQIFATPNCWPHS